MDSSDDTTPSMPDLTTSWAKVYEATYNSLLKFSLSRTRNPADAEDLAQESLLCIGRRLQKAPIEPPMTGYAIAIAKNLLIKRFKRIGIHEKSNQYTGFDLSGNGPNNGSSPVVITASEQHNEYVAKERQNRQKQDRLEILQSALMMLPKNQRELLLKWAMYDDEFEDGCQVIADELSLPRQLVAYEVSKAKSALKYRAKILLQQQR